MKGFIGTILVSCTLLFVFFPTIGFAQTEEVSGGLVTCGYEGAPDCDFCTFVQMVDKIIDFLFILLVLSAVLVVMIAGFKMVVSGGNVSAWENAKGMLTNVIVGLFIVMAAWLIVDTIMKALLSPSADFNGAESGFGMWNEIGDCGTSLRGALEPTSTYNPR